MPSGIPTGNSGTCAWNLWSIAAMRAAVKGAKGSKDITLDFYDRTRIATWVRDHGGVTLWVRQRIGKSVRGWRPYEPWAYAPEGREGTYILDDKLRIKTSDKKDGAGLKTEEGLNRIRAVLREPGKVARIVGLSGVGKNRQAQHHFPSLLGLFAYSHGKLTNFSGAPTCSWR